MAGLLGSVIENNIDNLYDFEDDSLEELTVGDTVYRADPDYNPSVIIGQAFGADFDEDSYNQTIADSIDDAQELYGETPVIAQSEVFECLQRNPEFDGREAVERIFDNSGEADVISDYTTAEVLEEAYGILEENGYNTDSALLVSHNAHTHRVLNTAEDAGIEGRPFLRDEVTWPEDDKQEWVQSPEKWRNRELASRAHHWAYFNVPGAKTALKKLGL